jgi:hypothetical protein
MLAGVGRTGHPADGARRVLTPDAIVSVQAVLLVVAVFSCLFALAIDALRWTRFGEWQWTTSLDVLRSWGVDIPLLAATEAQVTASVVLWVLSLPVALALPMACLLLAMAVQMVASRDG